MKLNYAHAGWRFLALFLDQLILLPATLILMYLLGEGFLAVLVGLMLPAAYYLYFLPSQHQATPGMQVVRIRVVQADGAALDMRLTLMRYLAFIMPQLPVYSSSLESDFAKTLMVWLMMGWFIPILFTRERTGVHDLLSGSRVIREPEGKIK